jgi:predicted regulator of Ras-like GTPase activity (Roadblock/LC7/MglB family)
MTIPFFDLFKKLSGRFGGGSTAVAEAPKPGPRVIRPKKTDNERLSKTVMPNATRSLSPATPDPFRSAAATASVPRSSMPLELGARKITTSAPARPRSSQLPPALARALEPKVERTISLRVADLIDAVPAGFIKPVEILDTTATVLLKASEIEKGMPEKHPTIALPSLYQQVPEIFLRSVRPDDDTRVDLPYEKVLEQFHSAQVRADQERDPTVPHVDTPILKATIEDSERFGTKIAPIETSFAPATPVKQATAESIADAEPDAMPAESEARAKTTPSGQRVISLHSPELTPNTDTAEAVSDEIKIPFEKLSPNGTGASASERVPASSGPPVPTPLPFNPDLEKIAFDYLREKSLTKQPEKTSAATPATQAPTVKAPAIPFEKPEPQKPLTLRLEEPVKATLPQAAKTAPEPVKPIGAPSFSVSAKIQVEPSKDAPSISFLLKSVLQHLPAFQLAGDVSTIADDERFSLPLSLVEPQLATGRVSIPADVFQKAVPENHRGLFQVDVAKTPVALPLEEVLKNLPATVLKLRDDQEATSVEKDFETPIFLKAQEDARRFAPKNEPERQPAAKPKIEPAVVEPAPKPVVEKLDPKEIIAQANALAGVKACAITFSDGLSLAGELPDDMQADGLCAMAPSMLERITQHVNETKLGELVAMTLYAKNCGVSFFARGNVCLTAVHEKALEAESRTRLAALIEKLSKTYAQPETPNVDH